MSDTYAMVQNGVVVNKVILSPDDAQDPNFTWVNITDLSPMPSIGWTYDGTNFTNPNAGLPNCAYGQTVVFSTDGITDSYLVGGIKSYPFAAGTSHGAVYLSIAIQENLALFQTAMQNYVSAKYSLDQRFNFNAIYILATQNGLINRAAYIAQLFTWAQSVVSYASSYMASVKALTDPTTVAVTVWDFTKIVVPDPQINPMTALGISN